MDELTKILKFFTVLTSFLCMLRIATSELSCDTLPSVPNARPENANPPFKEGRGVRYICNENYKANGGTPVAICEIKANGLASFTDPSLICEHVGCGDLPKLPMVTPVNPGTKPFPSGTRINYACEVGFKKIHGTTVAVCSQLSPDKEPEWDLPTLECVGVNCGDPGQSPHATRKGTLFTFPNNLTYTCDDGYRMTINRPSIFCLANEEWSASVPECEIITCPVLPPLSNGAISYSEPERSYQSVAEYSCNIGFKLNSTEKKRKCTIQGTWDGTEPVCGEVTCPAITSLKNGRIVLNGGNAVDDIVIVKCNPPNDFTKTLKCLKEGTWAEPIPVCHSADPEPTPTPARKETTLKPEVSTEAIKDDVPGIPCEDPGDIENGHLIDKIVFPTNQSIVYGCKEGFTVSGMGKLVCQRDGTWTPGTMPKCKKRLAIEIIAGIAVGVVSLLILVVVGVIFYLKKKKNSTVGNPGLKNKALSVDAKHVDEIRHLDKDKKPIPVTSL